MTEVCGGGTKEAGLDDCFVFNVHSENNRLVEKYIKVIEVEK